MRARDFFLGEPDWAKYFYVLVKQHFGCQDALLKVLANEDSGGFWQHLDAFIFFVNASHREQFSSLSRVSVVALLEGENSEFQHAKAFRSEADYEHWRKQFEVPLDERQS